MMPLQGSVARVERWIASIDLEKDRIAQLLARLNARSNPSEIQWGFLNARLAYLEVQRQQAKERLDVLRAQQTWEELMFSTRPVPAMLKATLRRQAARKRA